MFAVGLFKWGFPDIDFYSVYKPSAYIMRWKKDVNADPADIEARWSFSRTDIPLRVCTDEDLDQFWTLGKEQEVVISDYRHHMRCLDLSDPELQLELYGNYQ